MFSFQLPKRGERGFTLIELLVVIIIIGILAAIAIPLFLDQRKLAVDASVKSDVRNTATQVQTWQASGNYGTVAADATAYTAAGGKVVSTGTNTVGVSVASDNTYLVCGYVNNAATYKATSAAYVFDSSTGKFGSGTCSGGIVGGGSSPSASPTATATPTPTVTPSATPTPTPTVAGVAPTITTASLSDATLNQSYSKVIAATGTPSPTFSIGTNSWVNCAGEGGSCALPGTTARIVRFGVNGRYNYQTVTTGSINCDNATFGDPALYFAKGCDYLANPVAGAPTGFSFDANSGTISGTPTATGSTGVTITASNGTNPNAVKTYVLNTTSAPAITTNTLANGNVNQSYSQTINTTGYPNPTISLVSSGWLSCASENQNCTLPDSGSYVVRFGANGTYNTKTVTGGSIACNNATFGDPTPGVGKSCAYQINTLPAGLNFSILNNTISGTPTTGGSYTVIATASSSLGTAQKTYNFTVS